jgi:hypothetical protein
VRDITGPPGRWRVAALGYVVNSSGDHAYKTCVFDLRDALPVPTTLTADPLSWPDIDQEVVARFKSVATGTSTIEGMVWDSWWEDTIRDNDNLKLIGGIWWPLNGLFKEQPE